MLAELIVLSDEELIENIYAKIKKCLEDDNYILADNTNTVTSLVKTVGTKEDCNKKVILMRSKLCKDYSK